MSAVAASDVFPRPFGRYTLLANLAQGGMGALYLACQGEPGMEKLCVIKTVLPHLADKEYVARFRDEAKVVVRLSHGNLVPVFDAALAQVDGSEEMYLAMDYVDGKDLRAVWNRCAKKGIAFPVDVAVYIARELCRGLHHAHTASAISLVHRDVSPPNVLLSFFGEVKLTDFGLAASTMKTEKTAPGVIYGKVSYMSPEQARGEPLDGRTDQYAVGVILWELLTGKQLFPQSEPNLIARVRDPKIDLPSKHAERVPAPLDKIVMQALERDREARFADCEGFRAALSEYLAATAPTTDNARVTQFLQQLFGDEIAADREARQKLIESVHTARPSTKVTAVEPDPQRELTSSTGSDIIGSYLDGRYLVKRLIGEGGMGLVYEAEHVEIGRRVAIKILHAMFTRQGEVVARFRSEARAATRIGHPHIIDVFDSGTTVDGAVYFVMEFLDGRDLAETIGSDGPLTVERALRIMREICQALAAAHKAGIIHRDMKPENVFLVTRDGRPDFVKVLDFGIAKTLDAASDRHGRLTNPGMAMGTPEYMAPEQAAGATADARVDVYAVGAILYEMLGGRPPHEGANILEVLTRKATVAPKLLSQLRPDVPIELERLVMRMLSTDPAQRPQTMDALAEELGRLSGPRPSSVSVPIVPDAPARRSLLLPALAVMSALLAVGAMVVFRGPKPKIEVVSAPRAADPPLTVTSLPAPPVEKTPEKAPEKVAEKAPEKAPEKIPEKVSAEKTPTAKTSERPKMAALTPHHDHEKNPTKTTAPGVNDEAKAHLAEAKQMLASGRAALNAGRYAEAESAFGSVEASGFERPAALTGLGEVAFQRGKYGDAVQLARRAVDAGAGVGAKMVLGNSYFKLGKYDDAAREYREVLKIDHGHAEAQSNLAAAEKRLHGG